MNYTIDGDETYILVAQLKDRAGVTWQHCAPKSERTYTAQPRGHYYLNTETGEHLHIG